MITIVIPTIQKCNDNLYKLLNILSEDDVVDEIIVIDNTRKGMDFAHEKVRIVVPDANLYVNPAWNYGVKEARNEIVGLLNDDILVPENFCSHLYSAIKPDMGIIGMSTEYTKTNAGLNLPPKITDLTLKPVNYRTSCFGIAMFFNKASYTAIPDEIKIMFGDDWIIAQAKKNGRQNYIIEGAIVNHLGSISSLQKVLNPIGDNDKKLYKKKMIKWYNRLYSFEEYWDCYKLRLLGMTFKKSKKQEQIGQAKLTNKDK